jgi:hypothetical protein
VFILLFRFVPTILDALVFLFQHCGKYDYKEGANIVKITSKTSKNEYLET